MAHTVWTGIATILIVLVYFFQMFQVGGARGKYGVAAPATTGHPEFEKAYRVQMNTLEAMPLILPTMWIFAISVSDVLAAACGLVFAIGRIVYGIGYTSDPKKRGTGFMIGALGELGALIGAIYGLVKTLMAVS